jgi:hypothetical protein
VPARRADDDRDLANPYGAEPVPHDRMASPVAATRGPRQSGELALGEGLVGLVMEGAYDPSGGPIRAHPTREDGYSAQRPLGEFGEGRGDREGPAHQTDRHSLAAPIRGVHGELVPGPDPFGSPSEVLSVPDEPTRAQYRSQAGVRLA